MFCHADEHHVTILTAAAHFVFHRVIVHRRDATCEGVDVIYVPVIVQHVLRPLLSRKISFHGVATKVGDLTCTRQPHAKPLSLPQQHPSALDVAIVDHKNDKLQNRCLGKVFHRALSNSLCLCSCHCDPTSWAQQHHFALLELVLLPSPRFI